MRNFVKNEQGATLIELILVIILLGIAVPSVLIVAGQMAQYHVKDDISFQAVNLANSKLEEIYGYVKKGIGSPAGFAGTESLTGGFSRIVSVTQINDWLSTGIDVYQVEVSVTHPQFPDGYTLTAIL